MAIDNNPRTVDITVERVAENADSPTITAAISAPLGPTASRARLEKMSSILAAQAARVVVVDTCVGQCGDAEDDVGDHTRQHRDHLDSRTDQLTPSQVDKLAEAEKRSPLPDAEKAAALLDWARAWAQRNLDDHLMFSVAPQLWIGCLENDHIRGTFPPAAWSGERRGRGVSKVCLGTSRLIPVPWMSYETRRRPECTPTGGGARIGYTRVSTVAQTFEQQAAALEAAGVTKVFSDVMSGARDDRPGLASLMEYVREGDVMVVFETRQAGPQHPAHPRDRQDPHRPRRHPRLHHRRYRLLHSRQQVAGIDW